MAGNATARAALAGLSRKALKQLANAEPASSWYSTAERDGFYRQRNAAQEILAALDEERLERLASEQLKGLVCSDFASMDHDGMAETAVSLARSLIKALDES